MAAGPNEERLRRYLDPARKWQVFMAKEKWKEGASALQEVSDAVQKARPLARENLGNHTADAADKAFVKMHDQVLARQQQMKDGETALADAIEAMQRAEAVRNGFDADGPLSEPAAPDWDEDEVRQIQQMKSHNARMSVYNGQVTAREEAAAAAIQDLDSTNTSSAQTMRKIQGDRPEAPSGGGGGGAGGAGGGGPSGGRTPTSGPRATNPPADPPATPPTSPPADPPTDPPVHPPTNGETGTPLGPGTGTTPVGTPGTSVSPGVTSGAGNVGGLAGAVGGGLAGGAMGMGGATRGGLGAAAPTGAARAIGSSGRSASSGALGRGPAAGSTSGRGSAARGAGGRASGAGAGTGGRGTTGSAAGGRGAGRGAAGGPGGRGGRKDKDEKKPQIEGIIDDQDWVDDEDAAPGVIS